MIGHELRLDEKLYNLKTKGLTKRGRSREREYSAELGGY